MTTYSVHSRSGEPADAAIFLKQGFSWPAFLLAIPWCLWHRLWLPAALLFAFFAILGLAFSGPTVGILTIVVCLIFGLEANEVRRRSLMARGFLESAIVPGRNLNDAELRFFAALSTLGARRADLPAKPRSPDLHEPLGLFGTA